VIAMVSKGATAAGRCGPGAGRRGDHADFRPGHAGAYPCWRSVQPGP
jgi:hypothetical protein